MASVLEASELRDTAVFYQRQAVDDGAGGQVETWAEFHRDWAKITPQALPERYAGEQMAIEATYKIEIRRPPMGITHQNRVELPEIVDANPDGSPNLLDIRSVVWGLTQFTIQADQIARGRNGTSTRAARN